MYTLRKSPTDVKKMKTAAKDDKPPCKYDLRILSIDSLIWPGTEKDVIVRIQSTVKSSSIQTSETILANHILHSGFVKCFIIVLYDSLINHDFTKLDEL